MEVWRDGRGESPEEPPRLRRWLGERFTIVETRILSSPRLGEPYRKLTHSWNRTSSSITDWQNESRRKVNEK